MATENQPLGCKCGTTYDFRITMQPTDDLTGAQVEWDLSEGTFAGARVLLTKRTGGGGLNLTQDNVGTWQILCHLDPVDTATLDAGVLYHEAKVKLGDGSIRPIEGGPFVLRGSVNPAPTSFS
jgi:hypothetical protein